MAITASEILSEVYSGTDAASYTTASLTPTANRLILLTVVSSFGTSGTNQPNNPTVTGCGLTWVNIGFNWHSGRNKISLFRAMGSAPSSGALTIDFGGQTQSAC